MTRSAAAGVDIGISLEVHGIVSRAAAGGKDTKKTLNGQKKPRIAVAPRGGVPRNIDPQTLFVLFCPINVRRVPFTLRRLRPQFPQWGSAEDQSLPRTQVEGASDRGAQ